MQETSTCVFFAYDMTSRFYMAVATTQESYKFFNGNDELYFKSEL